MSSSDPAVPETVKREIAEEIARVHGESYGEQVRNVEVAFDERLVAVMMDVEFSAAERTLLDAGRADAVRAAREAYQDAIASVFMAIVERATGRRVTGFASRTVVIQPHPWSVEVFRLQPQRS